MPYVTSTPKVMRENRRHKNDRDRRTAHHGYFYSFRRDEMIPYRGTLAFDFLVLAEAHPDTLRIDTRPPPIPWWDGDGWTDYYPRYVVTLRHGDVPGSVRRIDVEVLYSFELERRKAEFDAIRCEATQQFRAFEWFTEKDLRVEPRLTNAKTILQYAGPDQAPEDAVATVRQVSRGTKAFTIDELVATGALSFRHALVATLNLVASGELEIETHRIIDGASRITRRAVQ